MLVSDRSVRSPISILNFQMSSSPTSVAPSPEPIRIVSFASAVHAKHANNPNKTPNRFNKLFISYKLIIPPTLFRSFGFHLRCIVTSNIDRSNVQKKHRVNYFENNFLFIFPLKSERHIDLKPMCVKVGLQTAVVCNRRTFRPKVLDNTC